MGSNGGGFIFKKFSQIKNSSKRQKQEKQAKVLVFRDSVVPSA